MITPLEPYIIVKPDAVKTTTEAGLYLSAETVQNAEKSTGIVTHAFAGAPVGVGSRVYFKLGAGSHPLSTPKEVEGHFRISIKSVWAYE